MRVVPGVKVLRGKNSNVVPQLCVSKSANFWRSFEAAGAAEFVFALFCSVLAGEARKHTERLLKIVIK